VPDGIEPMSFCNCESFEVHPADSSKFTLKLFGMYPDHTFQFEVNNHTELIVMLYKRKLESLTFVEKYSTLHGM
jgi:hypothetical protein